MRAALAGLLFALLLPTSAFASSVAPEVSLDGQAAPGSQVVGTGGPGPSGLAVDPDGSLWVTDYTGDRVLRFGPDGTLLTQWGGHGSGLGQFSGPFGIALDGTSVYVVDQLNNRIQKFAPDGTPLAAWGGAGAGTGQLRTPFGAAVASGGLLVADFGNDRVQQFGFDGQPVRTLGRSGSGDGQFTRPAGVAVDRDGNIYVSDHFNDRIEKFSASGRFLTQFGQSSLATPVPGAVALLGAPDSGLSRPEGIAVDRDGNLYVADYGRSRVVKLAPDGHLLTSWGSTGQGNGDFVGPKGVALDGNGHLYVADTGNGRIERFTLDGTFDASWSLTSPTATATPTPTGTPTPSGT